MCKYSAQIDDVKYILENFNENTVAPYILHEYCADNIAQINVTQYLLICNLKIKLIDFVNNDRTYKLLSDAVVELLAKARLCLSENIAKMTNKKQMISDVLEIAEYDYLTLTRIMTFAYLYENKLLIKFIGTYPIVNTDNAHKCLVLDSFSYIKDRPNGFLLAYEQYNACFTQYERRRFVKRSLDNFIRTTNKSERKNHLFVLLNLIYREPARYYERHWPRIIKLHYGIVRRWFLKYLKRREVVNLCLLGCKVNYALLHTKKVIRDVSQYL